MILKRKSKALLALTLALCLSVCLLPVTAQAADDIDTTQGGKIALSMQDTYWAKLKEAGATTKVEVYQVASVSSSGVYSPLDAFATDDVAKELASLGLNSNLSTLTELVRDIVKAADDDSAFEHWTEEKVALVPGVVDEEGNEISNEIVIPEGKLGMYLLTFDAIIVDGEQYDFSPLLLSVPALGSAKDVDNEYRESVTSPGQDQVHLDWQYEYTVFMKPDVSIARTEIKIVKDLLTYNADMKDVTFVFEVTVIDEEGNTLLNDSGVPVFSRNVSLTFDAVGVKELTVPGIPYGSRVRVREVYTGGYEIISIVPNGGIVEEVPDMNYPDGIVVFTITNGGPPPVVPNTSVVNHFDAYNPVGLLNENGTPATVWKWIKLNDNTEEGGAE